MKTTASISIETESSSLTKYTHCARPSAAAQLASQIEELEDAGFIVEAATSGRSAVPNSYRGAYKMRAPFYIYSPEKRTITLVDGQLENRPKGASIPSHFCISGDVVPTGYRCFKRGENCLVIRKA